MRAESKTFAKNQYMGEFDMTVMFSVLLAFSTVLSELVRWTRLLPASVTESNLIFYMGVFILIVTLSTLMKTALIGGFQSYETQVSIITSLVAACFLSVIFFGFRNLFDFNFQEAFQFLDVHLNSIFQSSSLSNSNFSFSIESFVFIMILVNCFVTFCLVPVIIRFGNCYIETLQFIQKKEAQIADEQNDAQDDHQEDKSENDGDASAGAGASDSVSPVEKQQEESQQQSIYDLYQRNMRLFNINLILTLLLLFLWITPITKSWSTGQSELILDILRTTIIIALLYINCLTFQFELEMYMARAYDHIKSLLVDSGPENLKAVQTQVQARFLVMIMIAFQIISQILVPGVLIIMILQKTSQDQLSPQRQDMYQNSALMYPGGIVKVANVNWNCGFVKDPKFLFWAMNNCLNTPDYQIMEPKYYGVGINPRKFESSLNYNDSLKSVVQKINTIGIVPSKFVKTVFSFFIFNFYLISYSLTIIYIFFIKKTKEM